MEQNSNIEAILESAFKEADKLAVHSDRKDMEENNAEPAYLFWFKFHLKTLILHQFQSEQNSKDIDVRDFGEIADEKFGYQVSDDTDFYVYEQAAKEYAKQFQKLNPFIEQAIINLEEYFEGKADADYEFNDIDGRYIPNEEMGLLNDVGVIKKYFGIE